MRTGLLLIGFWLMSKLLIAQNPERMTRQQYFEAYKQLAILEMERSGVPASITLAQGALESGDGNSRLARAGNNHFGIKCHNDWNGRRILEDDDHKNECFRRYASVEDSYRDHSDYLRTKSRYAFLFDMKTTDYKGWARGLKKAGYATSPTYAEVLIRIIEEYDLSKYDRMTLADLKVIEKDRKADRKDRKTRMTTTSRQIMERNRVKYIIAREGDSFESLTTELGKLPRELPQYNDIRNPDTLIPGQVIYIQPKRNRAETGKKVHIVKDGETMYTIAQLYAIKLGRLYMLNDLVPGSKIETGTTLQLRKAAKKSRFKEEVVPLPAETESEDVIIKVEFDSRF